MLVQVAWEGKSAKPPRKTGCTVHLCILFRTGQEKVDSELVFLLSRKSFSHSKIDRDRKLMNMEYLLNNSRNAREKSNKGEEI